MFDFGFWELALCLGIALVVLGPEKLPGVARTLGRWAGKARHYVRTLSREFEQHTEGSPLGGEMRSAGDAVQRELQELKQSLKPEAPGHDRSD